MREIKGQYTSIYRAYVASNEDPLEIGRIQVRVPFLHGTQGLGTYIPDKNLPYATPCYPLASYDSGMCLVPEVGSVVFVMFENGEERSPVYFGQCYGIADQVTVKSYGYPNSEIFRDSEGMNEKRACIDETPRGAYKNGKLHRQILFKSIKGQSIEICDEDERESFNIYDRQGQVFSMSSPRTSADSAYGVYNRGIFSVLKEKFTDVIKKPCILIWKALSGSKLRFISDTSKSTADLLCVYKDKKSGISIDIGEDNRLLIHYQDSLLEMTKDSVSIQSDTLNIKTNKFNINSEEVLTSSVIKVGSETEVSVSPFSDKGEEVEKSIEE